jgi:hypothetical protein
MVNDEGQLYTIEGVAAAILMVFTAYLIFSSTFILTPGDSHINDMQLEQLGNDVLKLMDTSVKYDGAAADIYEAKQSLLEDYVAGNIPPNTFSANFQSYANDPNLHSQAVVYYRDNSGNIHSTALVLSDSPSRTGRDFPVKVSKWVHLSAPHAAFINPRLGPQTVLLEVLLWRN